jgi:hypothetical protein
MTVKETAPTVSVALSNVTGSEFVYAYVSGQALDHGMAWMFLQSDGVTPYYLPSPPSRVPLGDGCAITLNASGADPRTISIPHIAGGRLWLSIGRKLVFYVNPGPAIVTPSVTNDTDPNIAIDWGFCEFTYDSTQLFANISFVDFVSLPIALSLETPQCTQTVRGLPARGLSTVCTELSNLDGDWSKLIVTDQDGSHRRVLSPNQAVSVNPMMFSGYLDDYIDQVWQKYAGTDLTIDTQSTDWGKVTGRVADGELRFCDVGAFTKPSTPAVFSCSQPPFSTANDEMGNLSARLAAALNRTTLLLNPVQPTDEDPGTYYQYCTTNHYARILHATTPDHLGYAFPYDDVHPLHETDFEGKVQSSQPGTLTVTVGPPR